MMFPNPAHDWDDAYANMAHVPGAADLPAQWAAQAAAYRASGVRIDSFAYGAGAREHLDIVWPEGAPKGLAVFVHGGYWMRLSRSDWTDLASGARARGWAVCFPGYTLAPEARISQMTRQIGAAIEVAAAQVPGPIRLAGHSAGGHLAARMICADSPLSAATLGRVRHTLSLSGVHDLRPLLNTGMNATLGLDLPEAIAQSPALSMPCPTARLTAWVGGAERPEFIRQARILADIWGGLGAECACVIAPELNHFTILDALRDPDSPLCRAFVADWTCRGLMPLL